MTSEPVRLSTDQPAQALTQCNMFIDAAEPCTVQRIRVCTPIARAARRGNASSRLLWSICASTITTILQDKFRNWKVGQDTESLPEKILPQAYFVHLNVQQGNTYYRKIYMIFVKELEKKVLNFPTETLTLMTIWFISVYFPLYQRTWRGKNEYVILLFISNYKLNMLSTLPMNTFSKLWF